MYIISDIMSKKTKTKNKIGGFLNTTAASILLPYSIATSTPLPDANKSKIFNTENIIFILYLICCVGAAYYVKEKVAMNYTELLLDLTYSTRNQDICGNTPIERDTVRYIMNETINSKKTIQDTKDAFNVMWIAIIVSIIFILWYLLSGKGFIPQMPKQFDTMKSYITNVTLFITMVFLYAFWYIYTAKISKTEANALYLYKVDEILKSPLLPKPKQITTTNEPDKLILIDSSGSNISNINMLYNTLFKRMMYVDNLYSYQDGINKWNSFSSNADIFKYLIFSNINSNNITSETINAQDNLKLWQNELKQNTKLAKSVAPTGTPVSTGTPALNCIQNISLSYTSSSANLNIVYNTIRYNKADNTPNYSNNPSTITIPTKLQKPLVDYINNNILTHLNSKINYNNETQSLTIPSTISGISDYFTVLIGTQNIDNDYTILYNEAKNQNLANETLQNIYWLSTVSNGDPSEEINASMYTNKILYYVINVLISYLPFHFFYINYGGLFTIIVSIILISIFIILYQFYISYKTRQAEIGMFHKNYTAEN